MSSRAATRVATATVALTVLAIPATAIATSSASAPRDGYYAPLATSGGTTVNDNQFKSAALELFVIDSGKQVQNSGRFTVGLSCVQDAAEQAEGLNPGASYLNVYVPPGRKLAIKGDSFSYSGPAYLDRDEIPAGVKQPAGTLTIKGTFKPASQITGTTLNHKVVAFKGTVSATLCPTAHPTFTDFWSESD
jgi:hypothetical protein